MTRTLLPVAGTSKMWVEGFYDPSDGEADNELYVRCGFAFDLLIVLASYMVFAIARHLNGRVAMFCSIRYRFLGSLHECVFADLDEVCIPMQGPPLLTCLWSSSADLSLVLLC